jgi:tRNA uridine 5-carboxymethylaminomethyl modification enzyme
LAEMERASVLLAQSRREGQPLEQWLRRPEIEWADVVRDEPQLATISQGAATQVTYDLKYAGYVARQEQQVARQKRLAEKRIPEWFDYAALRNLRHEAREKFSKVRPITLAQASRISGITPADVALVMAYLEG